MPLGLGAGMAIYGGLSAAASAGSSIASGKMNKKNRQWQEDMYERQLEDNRANADLAWQRQNEFYQTQLQDELKYSDPQFQVNRMRAAGINPNLMAGQISDDVSIPSGGSAPEANPSSFESLQQVNPIGDLPNQLAQFAQTMLAINQQPHDIALTDAQAQNVSSGSEKIKAEIEKLYADKKLTEEQTISVRKNVEALEDYLNNVRPREIKKLDADTRKILEDTKKLSQEISQSQQIFPSQLAEIQANLRILDDNVHLSAKKREIFDKEYQRYMDNIATVMNIDKASLEKTLNDVQAAGVTSNIENEIMQQVMEMYRSIPEDDEWYNKITKLLSGMAIMYLNRSYRSLPTFNESMESYKHFNNQ